MKPEETGAESQLQCCCNHGERLSVFHDDDWRYWYTVYCTDCGEETDYRETLAGACQAWIEDDERRFDALEASEPDETEDSNLTLGLTVGMVNP